MSLVPGTKLGPYEIGAPLGAGGMGEVYRARDTRLERTVAIKILPAQFSSDPVRKQRFEREAKTISSLNHPHICVLHDVGSQDGISSFQLSKEQGPPNIYWQRADGSGGLERLTTSEHAQVPISWSPDGQLLAFIEVDPSTQRDIWMLRMADRKVEPFLKTRSDESVPRFSPDGHWLAYTSNESGRYEVYVQLYPGPGGKWQISTEGGTEPMWNPTGRELFFRSGDGMMTVDIAAGPTFAAGKPRKLFTGPYELTPATSPNYDVSPDGQRFLMLKSLEQEAAAPTQINVVLNWIEELKRRVPTGQKP